MTQLPPFFHKGKTAAARLVATLSVVVVLIVISLLTYVALNIGTSSITSATSNQSTGTSIISTTFIASASPSGLSSTSSSSTSIMTASVTLPISSSTFISSSTATNSQAVNCLPSSLSTNSNGPSNVTESPVVVQVQMQYNSYFPKVANVIIGTNNTVAWTNDDSVIHTVTSCSGLFDSGSIYFHSSFKFTFTTPGNYSYYCKVHPNMIGTIIVQAAH